MSYFVIGWNRCKRSKFLLHSFLADCCILLSMYKQVIQKGWMKHFDSTKSLLAQMSDYSGKKMAYKARPKIKWSYIPLCFVPLFVKALLIQLERNPPIDAKYDPDIVQTWLSNNEPRKDLIAHSSALNNVKAEFIINLTSIHERKFATRNAKSQYSHIFLPTPSRDEHEAMSFLTSENYKQSDEASPMYRNKMEKYLRRKN